MSAINQMYQSCRKRHFFWLFFLMSSLLPVSIFILLSGATEISYQDLFRCILFVGDSADRLVVWQIRLPRLFGALLGGASLALSGAVLQAVLKNPLAAPTTLGISQGAAFGAALGITCSSMFINSLSGVHGDLIAFDESALVSLFAFFFSVLTTFAIVLLTRLRRAGKESIILAGVTLSSLFMAGTTFLQYFADETQLAMIVHWTFGDLSRASWPGLGIMGVVTVFSMLYFFANRLNYNAILAGDEVAQSLGVNVVRLRLVSMLVATLATAVAVSLFGILGFVGLVAPHMGRRLVGSDNRFLLPVSAVLGALILLLADVLGQIIIDPVALPAGVITSFFGAPIFLLLLFGRGSS